jgi:glycosyltransferase involved in cell wall biosynthesis
MDQLSIVIPTYNRPEFLRGAVESAVEQTYDDLEIIVVDDGSVEDYAMDVTEQFPPHVRCVIHETNRGLSAARNTGIESSSGEYVAFLDDDDRWREDKLELQVEALADRPHSGLATCRLAAIDMNGDLLRCDAEVVSGDISNKILTRNVIGTPSRVVIRRSALPSDRPFDEELPTTQDWDFYIRLCQNREVVDVNEVLCYRTRHEGMSSDPADAKDDNMHVIEKHRDEIESRGLWSEAMAQYYQKVGATYLLDGKQRSARKALWKSLQQKFVPETAAMLALTLANDGAFRRFLSVKRWFERRTRDCGKATDWNLTINSS